MKVIIRKINIEINRKKREKNENKRKTWWEKNERKWKIAREYRKPIRKITLRSDNATINGKICS